MLFPRMCRGWQRRQQDHTVRMHLLTQLRSLAAPPTQSRLRWGRPPPTHQLRTPTQAQRPSASTRRRRRRRRRLGPLRAERLRFRSSSGGAGAATAAGGRGRGRCLGSERHCFGRKKARLPERHDGHWAAIRLSGWRRAPALRGREGRVVFSLECRMPYNNAWPAPLNR